MLDFDSNDKYWFYYLGGGIGSGVLLIVIAGMCVFWKCRKHAQKQARHMALNLYGTVVSKLVSDMPLKCIVTKTFHLH